MTLLSSYFEGPFGFNQLLCVLAPWSVEDRSQKPLLVSTGTARSEHASTDRGGAQVVEHSMIGQDQHTRVVLHWRRAIEDGLAQEQR